MMPLMPHASVIIPFAGGVELLAEQLDAIRMQSGCESFEVIISRNGRTDPAQLIAESAPFTEKCTRVRIVDSRSAPGPSGARNSGAVVAEAPLLLFCDSDDVVHPAWVGELQRALRSADMAGGRLEYLGLNGPEDDLWNMQSRSALPTKFEHLAYSPSCNLGIRAEVFDAVGGFRQDLTAGEDIDFCWRAQYLGFKLGFAPDAVVSYRLRTSLSQIWRQAVAYGRSDAVLLLAHRPYGARRHVSDGLREFASVCKLTLAFMIRRVPARRFVSRGGNFVGRLIGSAKLRVWAL